MDQAGSVDEADTVATLLHRQHMRSGKVTLRDFNFERPTDRMEVSVDSLVRIGDNAKYEVYDYPGLYAQRNDGEEAARRIMEIEEARHEILDGTGNVRRPEELPSEPQSLMRISYAGLCLKKK